MLSFQCGNLNLSKQSDTDSHISSIIQTPEERRHGVALVCFLFFLDWTSYPIIYFKIKIKSFFLYHGSYQYKKTLTEFKIFYAKRNQINPSVLYCTVPECDISYSAVTSEDVLQGVESALLRQLSLLVLLQQGFYTKNIKREITAISLFKHFPDAKLNVH